MLFANRDNLRSRMLILTGKLLRTKDPNAPDEGGGVTNAQQIGTKPQLQRCLTTVDLTSLGVGSCVGTGMYLVAGIVANKTAGPGVILSFIVAAVAALFSGVCYAEFGVRVPHTTGSAYMYSYVTVGEFIAFVIGWNMILEYLIGTAAGACAISACIDAMAGGAISKGVQGALGTMMGHTPDVLGAFITLLMTVVLIAGVKKSLMFNNVLNAVNLAVWVFIMTAGCFYADTSNWSADHGGFLPMGWSGVLSGAATCFYAFIGFDIIATTGEEARDPRWSIPLAIILSLVIILTAYISSSVMMTLVLPWEDLHAESALVEMFGQRGAHKSQVIVAVGALAGLTVSMFGSMFPMPRIVYAMAKDGLIFRTLSSIWTFVGTPALATGLLGLLTAMVSLLIGLDVLVEMMSIGTLMAYTLVSTCVLLLRYQPLQQTTLVDLLPESIRSACPTPSRETAPPLPNLPSSVPGLGVLGSTSATNPLATNTMNRITIRAKTRMDSSESEGSPTSPVDTQPPWVPTNDAGTKGGSSNYDGKSLIIDEATASPDGILGGGSGGVPSGFVGRGLGGLAGIWSELRLQIRSHLKVLSYRCPGLFFWHRRPGSATEETGRYVIKLVGFLYFLIITFDLVAVIGSTALANGSWFPLLLLFSCLAGILTVVVLIARQPQNRCDLKFKAPYVPLVPAIAVLVNIYLILRLSYLTLVRFCIWMTFGLIMYFCYGIKHSSLEDYYSMSGGTGVMPGSTSGGPYYNDTAMGIELQIPDNRKTGVKDANERTPINGDLNRLGVGSGGSGQGSTVQPPQLPQRSQRSPSATTPASVGRRWETFE